MCCVFLCPVRIQTSLGAFRLVTWSRKRKERAELVSLWICEWFAKMSLDCVWLWGQNLQWDCCLPALFLHTPTVVSKWPLPLFQCSGMRIPHFLLDSHKNAMLHVFNLISGTLTMCSVTNCCSVRWKKSSLHKGLQHPQTLPGSSCIIASHWYWSGKRKGIWHLVCTGHSKTATIHRHCAHFSILRGWMSRKN